MRRIESKKPTIIDFLITLFGCLSILIIIYITLWYIFNDIDLSELSFSNVFITASVLVGASIVVLVMLINKVCKIFGINRKYFQYAFIIITSIIIIAIISL